MNAEDIFRRIVFALETARIPYMLTGSFASAYHGTTRATQDIDLIIAPTTDQLQDFVRLLPSTEYHVDLEAAREALRRQSQFNVIDFATGWKIDLIIRKSRPFSIAEFERRVRGSFQGLPLYVASAEDMVVAKLEWAKLGNSQRQLEDVAHILMIQTNLNRGYIERWVEDLKLESQWKSACSIAKSTHDD